ncbi:MAG TPA: hypothetical protein VIN03_21105, partial [Roseateles sp.]
AGGGRGRRGAGATSAPAASAASAGDGERPRWEARVPPEMVEKLRAMSSEDRRAWLQEHRASAPSQ